MSRSYDLDHEADAAKNAVKAIVARIRGVFDDPYLMACGPLSTNTEQDVLRIALEANAIDWPDFEEIASKLTHDQKIHALRQFGFIIGECPEKIRWDNPGKEIDFLVIEAEESELDDPDFNIWTTDLWSVTGNDLGELVNEAFDYLCACDSDGLPAILIEASKI